MAKLRFDHDTTAYTSTNAIALANAAQLAYSDPEAIEKTVISNWRFKQFRFLDGNSTQAFVAGNDQCILVAFRGTEPGRLEDWISDIRFSLVPGPLEGRVHEGFYDGLAEVWQTLYRTIARFRDNKPKSLWFTGHSLGAALATLAVAKLRDEDRPVDGLYTFGQPRTGDRSFARNFNFDFKPYMFRFVNNNDIVTRVPSRSMGFSHVGSFRYFTEDGELATDISRWNRFLDRMRGRIEDIFEWGSDGIKDHSMETYVSLTEASA